MFCLALPIRKFENHWRIHSWITTKTHGKLKKKMDATGWFAAAAFACNVIINAQFKRTNNNKNQTVQFSFILYLYIINNTMDIIMLLTQLNLAFRVDRTQYIWKRSRILHCHIQKPPIRIKKKIFVKKFKYLIIL